MTTRLTGHGINGCHQRSVEAVVGQQYTDRWFREIRVGCLETNVGRPIDRCCHGLTVAPPVTPAVHLAAIEQYTSASGGSVKKTSCTAVTCPAVTDVPGRPCLSQPC